MAEQVNLPLTGFGDSTVEVAVDSTPDGVIELVKLAISADGSAVLIPADLSGLYVQERLESPQDEIVVATALAAGANIDLDCTDITTAKTGQLLAVDVSSSLPLRVDIQVVDGARVTRTHVYTDYGRTEQWRTPHVKFIELLGAPSKHFGASVTNLSASRAGDARLTFYWDERT